MAICASPDTSAADPRVSVAGPAAVTAVEHVVAKLKKLSKATKDPKDSGVTRNGNKVTVRLVSQAPAYSLREFKIKKGDEVTLILTNLDKVEDLTHGFAIPKYNVNFIVNPLETASVTFVADKAGVFWCYCTHFCHALHLEMRTRMIVEK